MDLARAGAHAGQVVVVVVVGVVVRVVPVVGVVRVGVVRVWVLVRGRLVLAGVHVLLARGLLGLEAGAQLAAAAAGRVLAGRRRQVLAARVQLLVLAGLA